jgi:hypothetical protein
VRFGGHRSLLEQNNGELRVFGFPQMAGSVPEEKRAKVIFF